MLHEGAHLIAFNVGILERNQPNPMWLVEGMASFFEPSRHGLLAEPGSVHWSGSIPWSGLWPRSARSRCVVC